MLYASSRYNVGISIITLSHLIVTDNAYFT